MPIYTKKFTYSVYPRPKFNTSEPCPEHKKYPYLLRKLTIDPPNQVWTIDITYTAVGGGHRAFVIAVIDLYSRKVLAYNVVNTMDVEHCTETFETVLESKVPGKRDFI
ncbi:MAG: DDE-type integrase/transposase/recombinase [Victivallaceae bacterium]|nr:DDE-type integrase/transposase/recombinase [Victivallaceae bacterium]